MKLTNGRDFIGPDANAGPIKNRLIFNLEKWGWNVADEVNNIADEIKI